MSVRSAVLLVPVLCGALRAQSLLVTTAGVVPARDDSIYALRVDPANYRGQDEVFLLEDGLVRVEADGRYSYTLRQVVQLLTPDGVEGWGELAFWHTPDRQRVRINWIRVVGEDGSIVRDGPAHQQEATPPVEPGAPVFSDRRAIQVTLGGLAPGTLVDYSYTLETVRPSVPGDFLFSWYVNGSAPVRRSRFTFDTPPDLNARVQVRNLGGAAHDTVVAGRRQRRWAIADIPEIVWQRYAGTPNGVVASIRVAGDVSWRTVGAWYDSLARDRYELTSEILAAHARELRGATTLHDSLRATYRWVAQDFRYVSLSLGDGGYQPRAPRDVFQTRFGDCKDKTTLFVSLARHMGLVAYPVLVNSDGRVDSLLPSVKQFDHMIAAVVRGGQHEYLDVTSPLTPYGEVPSALQAEVGLALPREGPRVVVLPAAPAERNRYDVDVVGSFGRDGRLIGRVTVSARGTEEYDLREEFAGFDQQDAKARDETLREYAHSIYAAAVVDSARYADGRDLTTPPGVTVWFTVPKVIGQMGAKYYFNLPLSRFSDPDALTQLDAEGPRRFPIDIASVNSPSVYRSAIEFELPEGWKAELPPPVSVAGPFGYYRAEYRQTGRTLRASREMGGLRGLVPPDSMAALRAWLRAVGEDRTAMIVLDRGTGLDLAADGAVEGSTDGVGALPDVVLRLADLSGGAKVVQEGEAAPSTGLLLAFSSTRPLESYHRAFGAEQMVFSAGGSRLAALQVTAAAYHTAAEAHRSLDLLGLFDLRSFLQLYVQQMGAEQASLGATRALALDSIGDRAAGWVLEFVTPMATLDMAMVFTARGRIGTAVLAVGPKGLQDDDLSALLRTVDDRVRAHATYLTDADGEALGTGDIAAADSALATATDVALHTIPVPPPDTAALTVKTATFARVNGWPQYALRVNGKGFTFPFGRSSAIGVAMTVTLHETEAQALKEVMAAERSDRTRFMSAVMSEMGELAGMADSVLGGDSTRIEAVTAPRIGARSSAGRAMLRGVFRLDLDAVVFARGRLSASVVVTHEPGGSDPPAAASVARDMLERMRRIAPTASEGTPAPALLAAVGRVVDAEHVVDSLVDARDFDGAFRAIERARLSRAPAGFAANTWNSLCWYASLYGHATRAIPACEAAVAPDTTNLAFRDSRGLGRALAGDLAGARVDFEYVVANTDGPFHDERAGWLETLRAGANPFTPEVLERLKRN